jgi:eukaryotic-like serine/threonine-protein kinase
MDPADACARCGASRMANAPAGLCPRCLLGHGLRAGQAGGPDAERGGAGGAPTGGWSPSRHSGILSTVDRAVGPVPRVLLRDVSAGDDRPALACSEAMPASAGDAGRYQLHGEIARGAWASCSRAATSIWAVTWL